MDTRPARIISILFLAMLIPQAALARVAPDFNRDVRPILSENCFQCHGSDQAKRKGKLRLDVLEGESAHKAIIAGKPSESTLIKRIFSRDPDELMPPADSHRKLTAEQKEVLKEWISAGAHYAGHWSFQPLVRPSLPRLSQKSWARNEIDHFILARLETERLKPSKPASLEKLFRRASLDLTGLPPSTTQVARWKRESDPYSAAVDELLQSPQFGERMASDWMDVARYADTHGFNNDSARSMWRWRDWVIEAFNQNMPYDRFIRDQLAGDLLPNPSLSQLIATGFNRNHVINSEGGIIDEEYRVEYVADRVQTVSVAWLGLTTGCARCHDHKFDPISMKDYYGLFAFFNNVDEYGEAGRLGNAAPIMPAPTATQQAKLKELRETGARAVQELQQLERTIDWSKVGAGDLSPGDDRELHLAGTNRVIELAFETGAAGSHTITNLVGGKVPATEGVLVPGPGPLNLASIGFDGTSGLKAEEMRAFDPGKGWVLSTWLRPEAASEGVLFSTMEFHEPASSGSHGKGVEVRLLASGAVELRLVRRWPGYTLRAQSREHVTTGTWSHLMVVCHSASKRNGIHVFIDGEESPLDILNDDFGGGLGASGAARFGYSAAPEPSHFKGSLAGFRLFLRPELIGLNALADSARKGWLRYAASLDVDRRTLAQERGLRWNWMSKNTPEATRWLNGLVSSRKSMLDLELEFPSLMVMHELRDARQTRMLFRGQYDQPRAVVSAGVPAFLPPLRPDQPGNRLGLAAWLADRRNPLTARVVVNRFWQSIFGMGLVKSSEDFGFQSEFPSHPQLLDWLAADFVENGWDVKRLLRQMVLSATYRQGSESSELLNERDPENRLFARAPRFRLPAEALRDQALTLSGLLQSQIGGPPVFPYQPTNLYKGIVVAADYPGTSYVESTGPDLYRRSLYTFWKRTVPHPTLSTFDSPDREVCVARRLRTNTPLQALALMNDPIQVESARNFAAIALREVRSGPVARINFLFERATGRLPRKSELKLLNGYLDSRLAMHQRDPRASESSPRVGGSTASAEAGPAELASYAELASLILNLDETITRN